MQQVIAALIECLNDYCTSNQGDVGSWVREAAMLAIEKFVRLLVIADNGNMFLPRKLISHPGQPLRQCSRF